jgi:hypothetical protein
MKPTDTETLSEQTLHIAAQAAMRYLEAHGLTASPDALASCLTSWVRAKLPEALRDAREAVEAGMYEYGQMTYQATIALAGIEAAKEAGFAASQQTGKETNHAGTN